MTHDHSDKQERDVKDDGQRDETQGGASHRHDSAPCDGERPCASGHHPDPDHGRSSGHRHGHAHDHAHCGCDATRLTAVTPVSTTSRVHPEGHAVFYIDSMDCSVEENDIRHILAKIKGIRGLDFQLVSRTLSIDADPETVEKSVSAIRKAGYHPEQIVTTGPEIHVPEKKDRVWPLWLALTIACTVEVLHFASGESPFVNVAGMALSVVAIWLSGFSIRPPSPGCARCPSA